MTNIGHLCKITRATCCEIMCYIRYALVSAFYLWEPCISLWSNLFCAWLKANCIETLLRGCLAKLKYHLKTCVEYVVAFVIFLVFYNRLEFSFRVVGYVWLFEKMLILKGNENATETHTFLYTHCFISNMFPAERYLNILMLYNTILIKKDKQRKI